MHGSDSCSIHFLENADNVDGGINPTPTAHSGTLQTYRNKNKVIIALPD
jgi:hypothetical protein